MQWRPGGVSDDIEDRRSSSGSSGMGFGGRHIGIGGALVLLILSFVFHRNLFSVFLGDSAYDQPAATSAPQSTAAENTEVQFVSFVLDDVQATWEKLLPAAGTRYRHAKLVLFRDGVDSACGQAESATGPFYCPDDEKVYLDLGFFEELRGRFGAPGEFAQAYVIAHEMGHHVQKLLGIEGQVQRMRSTNPREANPLSVRLELQADCFAGIWAMSTEQRKIVDQGDIPAAMQAAAAVGDDRLQKMATGHVSPDSFTHGSSRERMQWFQNGLKGGQISACDTFGR